MVGYFALTAVYNVFFHPLRRYPGPLLYRASKLPRAVRILRGRWTRDLFALTEAYGPVVRVAPGELVYTTAAAWRDVYGHHNGAAAKGAEFAKDAKFYRTRGFSPSILAESRDNHALIRRQLSHGFSEKSLRAQEPIIKGYVDLLMQRLRERCPAVGDEKGDAGSGASNKRAVFDMRQWFNFITFDVIGDMAFGEPFGCLEKGELDERVAFYEKGLSTGSQTYFMKEIGADRLASWLFLRIARFRTSLVHNTSAVLRRRMNLNVERPDLIEGLLRKNEDWVSCKLMSGVLSPLAATTNHVSLTG